MKLKNLLSKKKEPDWQENYHYQKARADALEVKVFHLVDGLDKISICIDYEDKTGDDSNPVYRELPGWQESTVGAKSIDQLPPNAQAYIKVIEESCEIPIDIVSTGPDREDTILLRDLF